MRAIQQVHIMKVIRIRILLNQQQIAVQRIRLRIHLKTAQRIPATQVKIHLMNQIVIKWI